jgi:hypothetical protein
MATDTPQAWTGDGALDEARVEEFAGRLMETFAHGRGGSLSR